MKRLFGILLAVLLLSSLCFQVSAVEPEEQAAVWALSEDGETLRHGDQVYQWYPLAPGELLMPEELYVYETRVKNPLTGQKCSVLTVPGNPDMVFLQDYAYNDWVDRVYVTAEGKEILDAYCQGEYHDWNLMTDNIARSAGLSSNVMESLLQKNGEPITMDVRQLQDVPVWKVMGSDRTGTLRHIMGGIYELDGLLYYVNYDELDNTHFDANGQFSFRRGTVEMWELSLETQKDVRWIINQNLRHQSPEYIFEAEEKKVVEDPVDARLGFLVLTAVAGLLVPAVPLVLGLIFARSKKAKYPHRWYLLSILSGLWMVVAAGIAILIMG